MGGNFRGSYGTIYYLLGGTGTDTYDTEVDLQAMDAATRQYRKQGENHK